MKTKRKIKNMTKFVIVSIVILVAYTITCFVAIFNDKEPSDTLTVCIFSAFTGELAGLLVKKIKDKKNNSETGEG